MKVDSDRYLSDAHRTAEQAQMLGDGSQGLGVSLVRRWALLSATVPPSAYAANLSLGPRKDLDNQGPDY